MTTAHRPTWKAAVGQDNEGGWNAGGAISHQRSVLDAPAHTKLKVRQQHQVKYANKDEMIQQSLLAIQEATREANKAKKAILQQHQKRIDPKVEEQSQLRLLERGNDTIDVARIKATYDDSDVEDDDDNDDENSDLDAPDDDDDDDDSDEDDDDDDDEALLQAELAKIRAEREVKKQEQEAKEAAIEMQDAEQAAMIGNPLLNFHHNNNNKKNHYSNTDTASVVSGMTNTTTSGGRLKRRWNDDIVFRNQAKSEPQQHTKRFINDTVRNDFHKRFLNKFMR
jgi:protein CWC15